MTNYSPKAELYVNSAWTDISTDCMYDQRFVITRGRRDEGGQGQPSSCAFTIDNRSGNYAPRNPTGAYYGTIGRNTPFRVSLPSLRGMRLILDPTTSGNISAPDTAGLSITGDLDVRGDIWLPNWSKCTSAFPVYKTNSYRLFVAQGYVGLHWQYDSNTAHTIDVQSTVKLPIQRNGRLSIRATLDVDNGAAGNTVTFYYSTTAGTAGPWTALGSPVVTAGTTVIWDSPSSFFVYSGEFATMEVFSCAVYSGIAGVLKANPIFTALSSGTTSFSDAQGNTYTLNSTGARVDDRDYRFWGEISEWPQVEDNSGTWRAVEAVAAGPLRRLLSGTAPFKSAMTRAIATISTVVGWWPGEDGQNSTSMASGVTGQVDLAVYGSPQFASNDTLFPGAGALMVMDANTRMRTYNFLSYTDSGQLQVRFLIGVPTGGYINDIVIMSINTNGTLRRIDLVYTTTGTGGFYLKGYDEFGALIYAGAVASFDLVDKAKWVSLEFTQVGADTQYTIAVLEVGASAGATVSASMPGYAFGIVTVLYVNWGLNDMSDTVIGHIIVQNDVTNIFDLFDQLNAYNTEEADDRLRRLIVNEQGLRFAGIGVVDETNDSGLGYQKQKTLADLMHECEDQDGGILTDMRNFTGGLVYRSRDSLYGQDPALSLSYSVGKDLRALEMTEDDQATANNVTVTRIAGSSSNAEQTTGALNTAQPPTGVGQYEVGVDVSLATDLQTINHAGWRLHLGTVEEPRCPNIEIWAERSAVSDVQADIASLDLGDRIQVTNVPTRRLAWDIDALVVGITEELDQFQWHLRCLTRPERPWRTGEWGTDRRYSPVDSTLAAGVNSSATTLSVATNSGSLWTTTDVPFDILIAGERITVTAVAGAASPQSFTVTRAVNSVSKAQSSGAAVALWDPSYWAL